LAFYNNDHFCFNAVFQTNLELSHLLLVFLPPQSRKFIDKWLAVTNLLLPLLNSIKTLEGTHSIELSQRKLPTGLISS